MLTDKINTNLFDLIQLAATLLFILTLCTEIN